MTDWSGREQAQGELSLARVALAEDDLKHAANHIAGAIGHDPTLPEIHELLAALAARSLDGGLGLFPVDDGPYVGTVVAHAHLLARSDPGRALSMLAQATGFDPSKPWADAAWVRAATTEGIDPALLTRVLMNVIRPLGEPVSDDLKRANAVWLDVARHAVAAHPADGVLHGAGSALARRLGETTLAVTWGERGLALEPGKITYVWYAYALRTDGRLDEAVAVMNRARQEFPLDIDLSADIASWLADAGRLDEALAIIEDAVRVDPTYDCGVHTAHRLRFRRDGDAATHLVALSDFMATQTEPSHEHTDLADCCQGRPWLGQPAWATEAIINAYRQVTAEQPSGVVTMSVTQMEAPSAHALLARALPGLTASFPPPPAALVTPLREGPVLWRYDGTGLVPATAATPSLVAGTLLSRTVTPQWPHPVAAYDQALPLGELAPDDLLASLVHPPTRPLQFADLDEDVWVRSVQAFACVGLLHTPGQPRALLTQLAYGIEDWITEAALFGLAVAAWVDPSCRAEVAATVADRYAIAARAEHVVTILPGLANLVLIVPGIDEGTRAHARSVLT